MWYKRYIDVPRKGIMTGIAVVAVQSIASDGLIVFKGTPGTVVGCAPNGRVQVVWSELLSERRSPSQSPGVKQDRKMYADPMDLEWAAPPVVVYDPVPLAR